MSTEDYLNDIPQNLWDSTWAVNRSGSAETAPKMFDSKQALAIILRDLAMLARESRSSNVSAAEYIQHCEQVMQRIEKAFPTPCDTYDPISMAQPSPLQYVPSVTSNGAAAPTNFPIDKTDEWESRQGVAKQAKIPEDLKDFSHHFADMDPVFRQIILNRIAAADSRAEKAEADAQRLYEALKALLEATRQEQCDLDCNSSNCPWVEARAAIAAHEENKQ